MADRNGITLTLDEVSQTFDLSKLLDDIVSKEGLDDIIDEVKDEFVRRVISEIEERTLNGHDINGNKFKPYTKAYADEKGVSRSDVDLYARGDLLNSIEEVRASGKYSIKIAVNDGVETLKAYNHNVGDTLPKRKFFGVTTDDARRIAREVIDEQG